MSDPQTWDIWRDSKKKSSFLEVGLREVFTTGFRKHCLHPAPLLVLIFSICSTDLGKLLKVEILGLLPEILTQEAQGGAPPWNPHFIIYSDASLETDFLDGHWRIRPSRDSQPGCCLIALEHFRNTDAWAPPRIHYTRISGGRAWELSSLAAPKQFWCAPWARLLAMQLTYLGRNWHLTAHMEAVMFTYNLGCLLKPHNNLWVWYNYPCFIVEKNRGSEKSCMINLRTYILCMLEPALDFGAKDLF